MQFCGFWPIYKVLDSSALHDLGVFLLSAQRKLYPLPTTLTLGHHPLLLACVDLSAMDTSNIRLMSYVTFCMAVGAHSVTCVPVEPCSANHPLIVSPWRSSLFPAPETQTLRTHLACAPLRPTNCWLLTESLFCLIHI